MVDIKQGQNKKLASSRLLVSFFKNNPELEGKLYIGYPILYTGGENIILDAIWISKRKGIVVFDLIEGTKLVNREKDRDALFNKVESELKQYEALNKGRKLLIDIEVVTYAPACTHNNIFPYTATNERELLEIINEEVQDWVNTSEELLKKTISVIQSVIRIKTPFDRSYIKKKNSRGAIIKRLEETIANLDNQQETAIIEYHDGLQRIRGLAGSGKTIVIALKAAYLHAINPDWNMVVTFNTRALKNQFKELIELFCIQKMGRKPVEDKIRVIQAWGSNSSTGIYYEFCKDKGRCLLRPTPEEIEKMNVISRDISETEETQLKKDLASLTGLKQIVERINSGQVQIEDYPEDMQETLKVLIKKDGRK